MTGKALTRGIFLLIVLVGCLGKCSKIWGQGIIYHGYISATDSSLWIHDNSDSVDYELIYGKV